MPYKNKAAKKKADARYYLAHRNKIKHQTRAYAKKHPEKFRAWRRKWRLANRGKMARSRRAWQRRNPESGRLAARAFWHRLRHRQKFFGLLAAGQKVRAVARRRP